MSGHPARARVRTGDGGEFPGQYPYTRGPYASMYRSKLWTMRMFAGFGTAEDTNERFQDLLAAGGNGLSTAFDLPTLMGRDSDDPLCAGRGRQVPASPSTRSPTWRTCSPGIDLGAVTTSMTINAPAPIVLAMYVAVAEEPGIARARARRHDPERHPEGVPGPEGVHLPAAAVAAAGRPTRCAFYDRGDAPVAPGLDLRLPHPRGRLDRGPGARVHAGQRLRLRRGGASRPASTSTTSPRGCRFFFNAHIDFFEEIAKFRAARRIWARWMRERYGATDERSLQLRFHTQTAGVSLTAQQPEVNIARVAIEALAGVLGGTQSLHTDSFDEALALPTEKAARIALRTQQVIAHETGVANVADPLGGSWFVEALTDEMERQAEEMLRPPRRARRRLDARRRGRRHRARLVPGRDRRGGLRLRAQAQRRAHRSSSASTASPTATTSRRRTSCTSTPRSRTLQRQAARRRSAPTGTTPRWTGSWPASRADAADPTINLMPTLLDAARAQATEGEIVAGPWTTCSDLVGRGRGRDRHAGPDRWRPGVRVVRGQARPRRPRPRREGRGPAAARRRLRGDLHRAAPDTGDGGGRGPRRGRRRRRPLHALRRAPHPGPARGRPACGPRAWTPRSWSAAIVPDQDLPVLRDAGDRRGHRARCHREEWWPPWTAPSGAGTARNPEAPAAQRSERSGDGHTGVPGVAGATGRWC